MQYKNEEKHFAHGLNFYNLFWVFFLGSFFGVLVETAWIFLKNGYIESRVGLVWGLFNLVYGFGALAMMVGLYPLRNKSDRWIMLGGVVIGTGVEYLSSLAEEIMFGSVSWDYSSIPLNIGGRVNLLYSVFWGFLAIFWVKDIYPGLYSLIRKIPSKIGKPLTWALLAFMIVNTAFSAAAVKCYSQRHYGKVPQTKVEVYAVKEFLHPYTDEAGVKTAKLKIFSNCLNLIRTLPALIHDGKNPNDVSNTPHEYTHGSDALRYFCVMQNTTPPALESYCDSTFDCFESLTN